MSNSNCFQAGASNVEVMATPGHPIVFGEYIEEAIVGAITLEKAARIQIISIAAGNLQKIPDDSIRQAKKFLDQQEVFKWKFNYFARRAMRANQNIKNML